MKKKNFMNRRKFLAGTAAASAAFSLVPRFVLGGPNHTPPSEKLSIINDSSMQPAESLVVLLNQLEQSRNGRNAVHVRATLRAGQCDLHA